jgi:hypothetical protein
MYKNALPPLQFFLFLNLKVMQVSQNWVEILSALFLHMGSVLINLFFSVLLKKSYNETHYLVQLIKKLETSFVTVWH